MGDALAWVLLLPLLLQNPGSQGLSCNVSLEADWTKEFPDTCLNFSGGGLSLPLNQSLQARNLKLLDLSGNGLQKLPWSFFKELNELKFLNVTNNPLEDVDRELATYCDLKLQADCRCDLKSWYKDRQDNCSDYLECLDRIGNTWHNFSTFHCPSGLSGMAIGSLAASGSLLLVLAIAGPVLVWRLRRRRASSNPVQGKSWTAQDGHKPGLNRQPRYSNRAISPKPPAATLPSPSSPDYENMFQGEPTARHQPWAGHRPHTSEDSDFYMNYEGGEQDAQPVYCNVQALAQAPRGRTRLDLSSLDEEEYVMPGQ
ncbi:leucine-rich repeat-containing protein 25 [Talpa occidentalis]|uniref:leucine-rich repeat-containing protein 25 n=1 Tax=Talpa occidentalis TaxID=50954 RepID=UPI00188F8B35|nr:leucine-rich repeat-containing protein 25 [Talpa occidentalis]